MEKRNPRRERAKKILRALLRQAREEAGIRQADLARKLGRKQGFVSKYELGDRRLDLVDLADICDALGISFTEFARRFDEKKKGTIGRGPISQRLCSMNCSGDRIAHYRNKAGLTQEQLAEASRVFGRFH